MTQALRTIAVTAALLLGAPSLGAETDQPSGDLLEIPPATWPAGGREACPSLRFCCVPGEAECVHPGLSRLLLAGVGGAMLTFGATTFLVTGDSLEAGDPQAPVMGTGLIALSGAALGAVADALTPGPPGLVHDRPMRPLVRLGFDPDSSYRGLGVQVDPTLNLGQRLILQPHLGLSADLGSSEAVDAGTEVVAPPLRSRRTKVSAGAELSLRFPYPLPVRRPLYTGAMELRYKPTWELRRRTLHPGEGNAQIVEHMALYPATFGLRWHVSPRQRYTLYMGPRVDWISFSDPGSTTLRRGGASLGRFYGEAWWQLDVPLAGSQGKTSATGRFNLGYIHSMLDNQRFDSGAVVGYFGPVELSFDVVLRRAGSPLGVQLTVGYCVATGGGAFFEIGLAPRSGKGGE
jgi:hypothetical protein